MWHLCFTLAVMILFLPHPMAVEWEESSRLQANGPSGIEIVAPVAGQEIQGGVVIRGNSNVDGFISAEVDFSYMNDATGTWFLIQESAIPVQNDILAVWDTTMISDGEYSLRLLVTLTDGRQLVTTVSGLHVLNYPALETDANLPVPLQTLATAGAQPGPSIPSSTPSSKLVADPAVPTPLGANPMVISSSQLVLIFGKGAAFSAGIFALVGAYLGIRYLIRQGKS